MKKIMICLVVFSTAFLQAQNNVSSKFVQEINDAMRLADENEINSAIVRLEGIKDNLDKERNPFPANEYIITMYHLSNIYSKQERLNESRNILDEAEKKLLAHGEQHTPMRRLLILERGTLHLLINDIEGAKKFLLQAKDIFEKERDCNSFEYATCLNNLALTYQKAGDYWFSNILLAAIEPIFRKYSSINNKTTDKRYLAIHNTISLNFYSMGDDTRALEGWKYIIDVTEASEGGGINQAYYMAITNYASMEAKRGNYNNAIEILDKIEGKEYGYMYKDYVYQNLIYSLFFSDNIFVVDMLKRYADFTKEKLNEILLTFSENERETYWSERATLLEPFFNAICWKYNKPELLNMAYNNTLYIKDMKTRFSRLIADAVKKNSSASIKKKYEELVGLKKSINDKHNTEKTTDQIKERIDSLEHEVLSSINLNDVFDESKINCDNIRKQLGKNEVAVEYIYISDLKDRVLYLGALIERAEYKNPILVKLCKDESLYNIIDGHDSPENLFVDSLYSINNDKLYDLIYKPLEKYLSVGETIYISPISSIHQINIQAISDGSKRLMDKYTIKVVTSTAKIIDHKNTKQGRRENTDAFLVGGVDYNENIDNMALEASNYTSYNPNSFYAQRSNVRGTWDIIPGSFYEAQQIDSILSHNNINTKFLSAGKANEEAFKELDGKSTSIIHIATHGFFYKDDEKSKYSFFDNTRSYTNKRLPMQYSGLLFAGANNVWIGKTIPHNIEDGILTAEEISHLDLSNTDLAVLSACDTGLGEIDIIDGVYGLQRGFKMAGVETILMSLWKIPDEATKILMVEFYKNLISGKTKHQSLKDAQHYLRTIENGKYDKPEFWASFIMLDGLN